MTIYAIISKQVNGDLCTHFIEQYAIPANKERTYMTFFVHNNTLCIEYVTHVNPQNMVHPIETACLEICIAGVESVAVYNANEDYAVGKKIKQIYPT